MPNIPCENGFSPCVPPTGLWLSFDYRNLKGQWAADLGAIYIVSILVTISLAMGEESINLFPAYSQHTFLFQRI